MEIQIAVPSDSPALIELHSHLRRHPASKRIPLRLNARQTGGQMSAFDVLNAVLTNGAAYGSLAVSLAAFFEGRRARAGGGGTPTSVTLMLNGTPVTVSGGSVEDIERLIHSLAEGETSAEPAPDAGEPS
ncbi:hypothetical protein ACFT9I_28910 [Streptomyces sp. NPDC057137]|uniref:effector-associated constant component EACC1 n=1 Tax=Streptomyces sp. NPDC057137 TaxID=3346030 RepID=UPI0036428A2B